MSPNLVQTSSLMSVGTMVIELREFNAKKKKKKRRWTKWHFSYNFGHKWYFSEIFGIQLSVDMCCALKSLKVRIS